MVTRYHANHYENSPVKYILYPYLSIFSIDHGDYIYLTSKSVVNILWFYINFSLTLTLRASNF